MFAVELFDRIHREPNIVFLHRGSQPAGKQGQRLTGHDNYGPGPLVLSDLFISLNLIYPFFFFNKKIISINRDHCKINMRLKTKLGPELERETQW